MAAAAKSKVESVESKVQGPKSKVAASGFELSTLTLYPEYDGLFPLAQARQLAASLVTNGVPVELRILPGEGHDLGANRLPVFRVIGEQCLTWLNRSDALANYHPILSWQAQAKPLWLFWTPAFVWG